MGKTKKIQKYDKEVLDRAFLEMVKGMTIRKRATGSWWNNVEQERADEMQAEDQQA